LLKVSSKYKTMEDISYDEYSKNELEQAKELTLQSLNHYKKILDDPETMASLKDGDKMALNLCFEETKKELESIEEAISKK
jgi:hypothetical protein